MKKGISTVLAIIMLLSLAACGGGNGKDADPNLGKYIGDQIDILGWESMEEVYEGENYIELMSGGKGTFCLDGDSTSITWKLDGETLTLSAEGMDCSGTLKDGVITTDFFGMEMTMTFVKDGTSAGGSAPEEAKTATGDVVAVELPKGWSLVSGTEMNGASGSDYICHAEEYKLGDPYLQTTKDSRDIDAVQAVLESEDPFGAYVGASKLGGITWYLAEHAAAAQIGESVCLVRGYECDFSSTQVQGILASLHWAE